jgi:replicative DNA helicase
MSTMLQDGKNILMVSLEMSENEMMKRINANVFDIDINSFRDLAKTRGELDQLQRPETTKDMILGAYEKYKCSGRCGKLFIKEFPAGSFSANMLSTLVQKFENEKEIKFDVIFIDYLGIMKSDIINPNAGLYTYVKSIGEEVRAQAVKLQVPIVSASQLNRSSIGKTDGDNSSISDSIGTAMTADFMLFCLQSEEMKKNCEMVLKVTKNRYTGITDTFMMNINYPKMRFSDIIENQNLPEGNTVDFGSGSQQHSATNFANNEVRQIISDDMEKIKEHDNDKHKDELMDLLGL